jgi:hypothetical protein
MRGRNDEAAKVISEIAIINGRSRNRQFDGGVALMENMPCKQIEHHTTSWRREQTFAMCMRRETKLRTHT